MQVQGSDRISEKSLLNVYQWITYLLTYLHTYLFTYSMEQSPSWEADMFAASQEIPHIL
jgi:hypothetical protein